VIQSAQEVTQMLLAWVHGWGGGPWFLFFPLFWLAAILFVAFLFRRGRWGSRRDDSPEQVLGERYARGEITEDEYRSRRTVLRER
jgi:putative membrane protein